VAELCRRLDGIPLAIELAAARVSALTPAEIASNLDRRFKLLTGGHRSALPRHQTLRNAIEWSYQLLDAEEQVVLERLSVFAGDFDFGAAKAVVSSEQVDALEILEILARSVAKSLVVAHPRGSSTRYSLLETVRAFAWEHLCERDESERVSRRHAEFYADLARQTGIGLRGPDEAQWRDRLEEELDNLRAALMWAISAGDPQLALQPIADLSLFGDLITPYGLLAEQAAHLDEGHPLAAVALGSATFAASLQGDNDRAQRLADEAWLSADSLGRSPEALWSRCRVANGTRIVMSGRDNWLDFGRQWLLDARELGEDWNLCEALTFGTVVPDQLESVANGEEALSLSLSLSRRIGCPSRISFAAVLLAGRLVDTDPLRVESLLAESAETAAISRNDWADLTAVTTRTMARFGAGDETAACETLVEAIERWSASGVPGMVVQFVAYLACLFHRVGDSEGAVVLVGWIDQRGYRMPVDNPMIAPFGAVELYAYVDGLPAADRERAARDSAAIDEAGMVVYARDRLTLLTNDQSVQLSGGRDRRRSGDLTLFRSDHLARRLPLVLFL
jgi:hypothetical protein